MYMMCAHSLIMLAACLTVCVRVSLCLPVLCRIVVVCVLRHHTEPEMQNRRVVCVANLKPAAMRGIVSQAMVLAATHPETGKVCVCCVFV